MWFEIIFIVSEGKRILKKVSLTLNSVLFLKKIKREEGRKRVKEENKKKKLVGGLRIMTDSIIENIQEKYSVLEMTHSQQNSDSWKLVFLYLYIAG